MIDHRATDNDESTITRARFRASDTNVTLIDLINPRALIGLDVGRYIIC
jgi:hypothetical protein